MTYAINTYKRRHAISGPGNKFSMKRSHGRPNSFFSQDYIPPQDYPLGTTLNHTTSTMKMTSILRKEITAIAYFALSMTLILISSCATPYASKGLWVAIPIRRSLQMFIKYHLEEMGTPRRNGQQILPFSALLNSLCRMAIAISASSIKNENGRSGVVNTPGYAITNANA